MENDIKEGKYFFWGILNFQNGINIINTSPILSEATSIGGTESFKTNLVTGKALPWAIAIKSKINKCLRGKLIKIKNIFEKFDLLTKLHSRSIHQWLIAVQRSI